MTDQTVITTQRGRYKVEMAIVRVPVPEKDRAVWRAAVARLYDRLEEEIAADKARQQLEEQS